MSSLKRKDYFKIGITLLFIIGAFCFGKFGVDIENEKLNKATSMIELMSAGLTYTFVSSPDLYVPESETAQTINTFCTVFDESLSKLEKGELKFSTLNEYFNYLVAEIPENLSFVKLFATALSGTLINYADESIKDDITKGDDFVKILKSISTGVKNGVYLSNVDLFSNAQRNIYINSINSQSQK